MLRRAGLLDIAHAAVHLHAERGDLAADVGRERLGDRRQQRGALVRGRARLLVGAAMGAVDGDGGGVGNRARGAGERAHGEQHALDVGMHDDRAHAVLHAGGAALLALARIGERLLGSALGDADALQRDREPRLVHHREHAGEAAVLLADQEAGGAALVAEHHGAGGRAVDAHLVLDRMRAHVVALRRASRRR